MLRRLAAWSACWREYIWARVADVAQAYKSPIILLFANTFLYDLLGGVHPECSRCATPPMSPYEKFLAAASYLILLFNTIWFFWIYFRRKYNGN